MRRPLHFRRREFSPISKAPSSPKKKIRTPKEISQEMLISWAERQIKAIDTWYQDNGQSYSGPIFEDSKEK